MDILKCLVKFALLWCCVHFAQAVYHKVSDTIKSQLEN
jgi:hypothetical protein